MLVVQAKLCEMLDRRVEVVGHRTWLSGSHGEDIGNSSIDNPPKYPSPIRSIAKSIHRHGLAPVLASHNDVPLCTNPFKPLDLGAQGLQRSPIAQSNLPMAPPDGRGALQLCKSARDRFDGQAEIVGYVPAAHRQFDNVVRRRAIRQFQHEGCQALFGILPAKRQQMLMGELQIGGRASPNLGRQVGATPSHGDNGASLCDSDEAVRCRRGAKTMSATGIELEHVSREMEGDDLAASIVGQLVASHGAGFDLVEIFGGFAFSLDFPASIEANRPTYRLERLGQRISMPEGLHARGGM
jgi:hypothetical protein